MVDREHLLWVDLFVHLLMDLITAYAQSCLSSPDPTRIVGCKSPGNQAGWKPGGGLCGFGVWKVTDG